MGEDTFKVEGMMCGGCTGSVEAVVKKIDGVAEVKANHKDEDPPNQVTVKGDYDLDAIKAAIKKAGFEPEE